MLVDAIADYAIYMLDVSGHVASWNAGARRFKGYTEDEILGQHFSQFYTPEDRETGLPQRALATAANEGRFEAEGWRVRKDGSRLWAHVVIDPIRNAKGDLIGFAKITRDISERRQAQLALQEAREQLFQAQKMEAIGQLTGGIAHDFNNLLTAIQSSLELLKKRLPDDPGMAKLLDNAMQGAQRGAALTQRMLAFARRQNLELEAVDLRALVSGMSDLLQRALGAQIRIETEFPDMPLLALTDPTSSRRQSSISRSMRAMRSMERARLPSGAAPRPGSARAAINKLSRIVLDHFGNLSKVAGHPHRLQSGFQRFHLRLCCTHN